MKKISEMTATEKIAHIRRLKKASVPLAHIQDLMQVDAKTLRVIFRKDSAHMTSEDLAKKLIY
jgi:DNA-directed RNA polymerase subunit F